MDNIKKKTFMQKFTSICKCISIVIPLIIDTLGIIALFSEGLQKFIGENLNDITVLIIIIIFNVILIANIVVFLEKTTIKKVDKTMQFIKSYKKIVKSYADSMVEFEKLCGSIKSIDELYRLASCYLKEFVDSAKDALSKVTNAKIRVCIKAFPEKYAHDDIFQMELITICRSDRTLVESIKEIKDRVPVHKNTDFKMIMVKAYPYFAFNNLKNFKRESGMEYENTTENWGEKYLSTIVFPISKCVSINKGKELCEVLGFLCVDTLDVQALSGDAGLICLEFIESLSCLLYTFLGKCMQYREELERDYEKAYDICIT